MTAIPFNRNLSLVPDVADEPIPGIRRVMANNPGPFTFRGTVSYIIGRGKVAILDPGPDDAGHVAALLDAVRNEAVTHILVTSHASRPSADSHGSESGDRRQDVRRRSASPLARIAPGRHPPAADRDFRPDVMLKDGDVVEGDDWSLHVDGP